MTEQELLFIGMFMIPLGIMFYVLFFVDFSEEDDE